MFSSKKDLKDYLAYAAWLRAQLSGGEELPSTITDVNIQEIDVGQQAVWDFEPGRIGA